MIDLSDNAMTALGFGLTATAVLCLAIRVYRYFRPVEDEIDWENAA